MQEIFLVKGRIPSFEEWYEKKFSSKNNDIALINSHKLLYSQGYDLSKFFYVGLTEKFSNDSLVLYKELGFNKFFLNKNISKKLVDKPNKDISRKIFNENKQAYELYENAKKINSKYKFNVKDMERTRRLLLPITQTLYDSEEYIHIASAYMRTKSQVYSELLDFLKVRFR